MCNVDGLDLRNGRCGRHRCLPQHLAVGTGCRMGPVLAADNRHFSFSFSGLLPCKNVELDARGELRFVVSSRHRIVAYTGRPAIALTLTEALPLSAHHESVPSGGD